MCYSSANTLQVSYLGMATQEMAIKPKMEVVLKADSKMIDEVVVTGYGIQRKASFTGAASIVGQDVIAKKTDPNFVKSLEGSIAGLQMSNSTQMPGAWGAVYIRGRGSLNSGTQPLYVIDGMPVNSETEGMSTTTNNYLDPMSSVNSADIENVTVLKDASATAIYGSRAANGVIVITTKKGSQGKFNINLDIKQGFVSMGNHNMDYADAATSMDLFAKGDVARHGGTYDEHYAKLSADYGWDGVSSYDWMDKVTRKGSYKDYNINAQGRSGDTGYYVSMGYLNSEGLVIGSDLERFTGRMNLDSKFKHVTIGVTSSFSYSTMNGFSQGISGTMASPSVAAVSSMKPFYPFYDEDGNYANINLYNPLALKDPKKGDLDRTSNQTVNISPYLQIDFGKGIYAKSTLGINIVDNGQYKYSSAIYNVQGMKYNGLGEQYNVRNTVLTWNNIIGWNYTFDAKHNVNVMAGQEAQRKSRIYEYYAGSDFPYADSGMRDLSTAGSWKDSEYYKGEARLASYFFNGHYSYEDKYYLSASYRLDGSSVFGSNSRWGDFWSVGAKWRVASEDFLKDNEVITNAALRVSYGTVGNQDLGSSQDESWYAARGFYKSGYNYNGVSGMVPVSMPNPDLTWEVSNKFNVGFDLSLINRLHLAFDFYDEITTDALFEVPLSMTTGLSSIYQNIGSISNRGMEVSLNATIIKNRELSWTAYANMTWNQNRIVKLSTDKAIEAAYTTIEEGYPFRQFYMREYAGVDSETGKPLWYLNKEGDETTSVYNSAAKRHVGSADPKLLGGFGSNLTWKEFDFNLSFNYRLGSKVYDSGAPYTGWGMTNRTPLKEMALNSWTEDNKGAKYPQYISGDPNMSTAASSRFLYSGSYLRVSNLALGYTLPAKWAAKAFIQKLRVYGTIDNLYTFAASDFVGYNPETYVSGIIAWQYPATRTFTGGIQITF